ncbi:phosphatase PAP2 family protein [Pannonibacter phragmitetus]|uniref:phosphatase PAP2 family protein n=1 Tax=Pannonibacter phragmitetus TaxID=121719 RepID=UPI003D2EFD46
MSEQEVKPLMASGRFSKIRKRFAANVAAIRAIIANRRLRAQGVHVPLAAGQRPQDLLAILLFASGLAVVLLDIPAIPWVRALPPEYGMVFSWVTDLGKSNWILWSTGLFCLAALAFVNAKTLTVRVRMAGAMIWTYSAFVFYAVALSGILVVILKWSIGRARPKLYEVAGPVDFNLFAFHSTYTSFPSGHSTTVAAFALALALIFPAWRWLIAAVAFWAAFSRVMVGAHYPSDVAAGLVLGAATTLYCARWMAKRRIGFVLVPGGRIRPIAGGVSARAAFRALWNAALGRRSAATHPSPAQNEE